MKCSANTNLRFLFPLGFCKYLIYVPGSDLISLQKNYYCNVVNEILNFLNSEFYFAILTVIFVGSALYGVWHINLMANLVADLHLCRLAHNSCSPTSALRHLAEAINLMYFLVRFFRNFQHRFVLDLVLGSVLASICKANRVALTAVGNYAIGIYL